MNATFPTQPFPFKPDTAARDVEGHLASRAALLRLLVYDDPLVTSLFRTFENLWQITALSAQLADVYARECGWRDRAHMYDEPDRYDVTRSPHAEQFAAQSRAFPWDRVTKFPRAAERLVHKMWSLPTDHASERWAWLAADLHRVFVLAILGTLMGRDRILSYASAGPTPSLDVSFKTRDGESPADARRRLKQWYEESSAALGTADPEHRGTIVDEARLYRDVEWFYRNTLERPPVSKGELTRRYVAAQRASGTTLSGDQRKTVREGVARARRLLSAIPG